MQMWLFFFVIGRFWNNLALLLVNVSEPNFVLLQEPLAYWHHSTTHTDWTTTDLWKVQCEDTAAVTAQDQSWGQNAKKMTISSIATSKTEEGSFSRVMTDGIVVGGGGKQYLKQM